MNKIHFIFIIISVVLSKIFSMAIEKKTFNNEVLGLYARNMDESNTDSDSKCTSQGGQCMNPNNCKETVKTGLCPGGNDNKCCVPTASEIKCTSQGGQCMNPNNCKETVKTGLCPGGNDNKCCVPTASEIKCTSQGGQCMNPNNCKETVKTGLCPGGNDNKCCVPTASEIKCTSQGGQCMNPDNCKETVKTGLCPGGNDNKCCVPTASEIKCTSQGGQCMNPDNCKETVKTGLCPGGNDNKCCVPTASESKCTSRGGQCMNPENCSGTVESGLCPGGNDNKCCIEGSPTNDDNRCINQGGQCMDPNDCIGIVESGLCPGGNDNKCCITTVTITNDTDNSGNTDNSTEWDCLHHKVCLTAYYNIGSTAWARSETRESDDNPNVIVDGEGFFSEGDWKCNLFVYEMLLKSGIDIGTPNKVNTAWDILDKGADIIDLSIDGIDRPPRAKDWYDMEDTINGEKSKLPELFELVASVEKEDRSKSPYKNSGKEYSSAFSYLYTVTKPGDIITSGKHIGIISKMDEVNANTGGELTLCISAKEEYIGHNAFGFRTEDDHVKVYRLKKEYLQDVLIKDYKNISK